MNESEIKAALGTLSNTQAAAVLEVLRAFHGEQRDAVCQPGLSDGDRHYNAGRLAAAVDLMADWPLRVGAAQRVANSEG
jgi:hypothetical protein